MTRDYTKLGLQILFLVILVIVSSKLFSGPFKNVVSTFSYVFRSQGLSNVVSRNLEGKDGEYAIYIESLTSDDKYTLRSSEPFPAASLYKVFLLAAVLKEVEEGNLKMEDTLSASKDYLTDRLGSLDFGYDPSTGSGQEMIEYSVEEALERVGRISDNFAAIMLVDKIGWDKVQAMAESLGTTNTSIEDPISTSAFDMALYFRKLYHKEIVSPSASDKIIEILSLSKINDRIPANLPEGVKTVHKTGELSRVRNDAGIVYLEGRPYVIVMMSQDLQYEDEGIETQAQISKEVFEYFQAKK